MYVFAVLQKFKVWKLQKRFGVQIANLQSFTIAASPQIRKLFKSGDLRFVELIRAALYLSILIIGYFICLVSVGGRFQLQMFLFFFSYF